MPILLVPQSAVGGTYQPPTFVGEFESAFNSATSPKSVLVTTQAGDRVVVYAITEDSSNTLSTPTGNSLTYSLQQSIVVASFTSLYVWTATDPVGGTNWTLQIARSAGAGWWGFNVLVFRNSDGIGASNKTNVTSGAPSLGLTTTQDASAIVAANGDWTASDGTSRTWLTINSITPTAGNGLEQTYFRDPAHYAAYGAYWSNAGATGAKTTGISVPSAQKYSILAVEVKGHFVSGGLSAVVGQASETDTSQSVGRRKTLIVQPAIETDVCQSVTRRKTQAVAVATETDVSQTIGRVKSRQLSVASETDVSQTVVRRKTRSVAGASENDLAASVRAAKSRTILSALETDVSQAISRRKSKAVATTTEIDTAQSVRAAKSRVILAVTETDLAQIVGRRKARAILSSVETDLSQSVGRRKTRLIGGAVEIDQAGIVSTTHLITVVIQPALETDVSQSVGRRKTKLVSAGLETDSAQTISRRKSRLIVATTETDIAALVSRIKRRTSGAALETDLAGSVARRKILLIGASIEQDIAGALILPEIVDFPASITTVSVGLSKTTIEVILHDVGNDQGHNTTIGVVETSTEVELE